MPAASLVSRENRLLPLAASLHGLLDVFRCFGYALYLLGAWGGFLEGTEVDGRGKKKRKAAKTEGTT